jgi:hypothetical protein
MRWSCERDGCFNLKVRPQIQEFADCFPGRINFGDVDGIVELRGRCCLLEWKSRQGKLGVGQRIMYERFGIGQNVVFVLVGDAETMTVEAYTIFWRGCARHHIGDMAEAKRRIRGWADWVLRQKG